MVYEEERGNALLAFTGDWLISRRLSVYREPRFEEMTRLLRDADVGFANSETLYHDYECTPIPDSGPYGTYAACDPAVIDDLRWCGIDMVSTANNHCVDYGEEGVLANLANLDEHGMPHAGTGRNLTEALAPAYLETPIGSVALVAATLTMPPANHRAGDARGPIRARPGANVIRFRTVHTVPRPAFDALREMGRSLALGRFYRDGEASLSFNMLEFELGDSYGRRTVVNQADVDRNVRSVRDARSLADWVVVSLHNHERGASLDVPSDMAVAYAHACIDAGADAFFGHGPHRERGIEIYEGKPIIYALGDFVLHNELIKWEPRDLYERYGLDPALGTADVYEARSQGGTTGMVTERLNYQTAIVRPRHEERDLVELELYPVDLGYDTGKQSQRGRPILADGEVADAVLTRLQRLSEPYGTKIEIDGGVGRVRVG